MLLCLVFSRLMFETIAHPSLGQHTESQSMRGMILQVIICLQSWCHWQGFGFFDNRNLLEDLLGRDRIHQNGEELPNLVRRVLNWEWDESGRGQTTVSGQGGKQSVQGDSKKRHLRTDKTRWKDVFLKFMLTNVHSLGNNQEELELPCSHKSTTFLK